MVLWLIGMSDAGKTVVGKQVYKALKADRNNVVFLDGDVFRNIMGDEVGHNLKERKKNADRICRMCKFLNDEKIHVVCAILSIFPESQKWNRENLQDYYEVYLKVSLDTLIKRDSKGLYGKALKGEIENVVGIDIKFTPPPCPNQVLENEGDVSIEQIAEKILQQLPIL